MEYVKLKKMKLPFDMQKTIRGEIEIAEKLSSSSDATIELKNQMAYVKNQIGNEQKPDRKVIEEELKFEEDEDPKF